MTSFCVSTKRNETMTERSQTSDIDRLSEAIENLQKSLECTICLEFMSNPTKTRCGHSFCKLCIGEVLQKKNACCPLCKKNLNRRNVSKDDHLQTYIEKFKNLVAAIQIDSQIDILSHSKQRCNTRESCSYSDAIQFSRISNKSKPLKEQSTSEPNKNSNKQTDKPSTNRGRMINSDNLQYDSDSLSEKHTVLSSLSGVYPFPANENVIEIHNRPDIKVNTWLYSFPNEPNTSALNTESETIQPIENKTVPFKSIVSDNDSISDTAIEISNRIDKTNRINQSKKQMTNRKRKHINEDNTSQINIHTGEARQFSEIKEIKPSANSFKYSASHARMYGKKLEKNRTKSSAEKISDQNESSSMTTNDQVPNCSNLSRTNISANWPDVIEFGKEMRRKKKVRKLDVSIEKNKVPPRIVENIELSPNSKYELQISAKIVASQNMNLSNAILKPSSDTNTCNREKSFVKNETNNSVLSQNNSMLESSFITLEEGRKMSIINLNNDQISRIIGFENLAENAQHLKNQHLEKNTVTTPNLSSSKRLAILTPEKLNESICETNRDVTQTPTRNFESSTCLPAENRTPESRVDNSARRISGEIASSQLQLLTPKKPRLSLKRKFNSPLLSQLSLIDRLSISRQEKDISTSKNSALSDQLTVAKRQLSLEEMIDKDELQTDQETDRETIRASVPLKRTIENQDNEANVFEFVRRDEKLANHFQMRSMASKRSSKNQECDFPVKFMQLGSLIKRRNVKYFYAGTTKREKFSPAEVRVDSVYNMQQSIDIFEIERRIANTPRGLTSPNLSNDSQDSANIIVLENICFGNNLNMNPAAELHTATLTCKVPTASTPKKNFDHINQKKTAAIEHPLTNKNQESNKLIEDAKESDTMLCAGKNMIQEKSSCVHLRMTNPVKLLSPDKDSQLKFLAVDSPMSEEFRRSVSVQQRSIIKENNSEMKSLHSVASTSKAQELLLQNSDKKKKKMRITSDKELFEDESSNDCSDTTNSSSRCTIKLNEDNESTNGANSDLRASKKYRSSSTDDQDIQIIPLDSKEQDGRRKKYQRIISMPSSDTESESTALVAKNWTRHKAEDQFDQRNSSIMNTSEIKDMLSRDSGEDLRIRNIVEKWSKEHNATQKQLIKENRSSQNNVKSMRCLSGEKPTCHQLHLSNNALETKNCKNAKSSQKSFTMKESDMFESNSVFDSENVDYILHQSITTNKSKPSSQKITELSNDIINRVLKIDRSQGKPDAYREKEKDSTEYLLEDNYDDIIANVELPQSEDMIPCTGYLPAHNRTLEKTSNCPAMTDEPRGATQQTPIIPSSTNDMFEHCSYSSRNTRKQSATNATSHYSDKENIVSHRYKKYDCTSDRIGKKDVTAKNLVAIDKDFSKKIILKHNVSYDTEKFFDRVEGHQIDKEHFSMKSTDQLYVEDNKIQRATAIGNELKLKDDFSEHDTLMNVTRDQIQLQMFEEDLFGIPTTRKKTEATKITSQNDPFQEMQHTPKKIKQNVRDKNATSEEHCANDEEDDVVENTPEKKMKNSGNNIKTIESRRRISYLSPISRDAECISNSSDTLRKRATPKSSTSTPASGFKVNPLCQSTPKVAHSSTANNRPNVSTENRKSGLVQYSSNILSTKEVVDKPLENAYQRSNERKLCLVCTGLTQIQITAVKGFVAKYNASYVNKFDADNVTHVIVNTTGEQNTAKSTLKYLQGIAHRKWMVSFKWIEDCIKKQKLLDEVAYETTTYNDGIKPGAGPRNSRLREKGLFEGFTFFCVGPYINVSLNEYEDLLLATGATVVNSLENLRKVGGIKGVVIQDIHDDTTIEHWYRTAKAAPIIIDWIVDSIGQYKLLKLWNYIQHLSPEDFYAIGYPRELVGDEDYSDDE